MRILFWTVLTAVLCGVVSAQESDDAVQPATAPQDSYCLFSFVMGYHHYVPNLSDIRDEAGLFEDNPGIYYALYVPSPMDKGHVMIGFQKYEGSSAQQDIKVTNIFLNQAVIVGNLIDRLVVYIGLGSNLLLMERRVTRRHNSEHSNLTLTTDAKYTDELYGLNALIGASFRITGPIYAGYEIGYMWSEQSMSGGRLYDLSDTFHSFTLSLMAFQ